MTNSTTFRARSTYLEHVLGGAVSEIQTCSENRNHLHVLTTQRLAGSNYHRVGVLFFCSKVRARS